MSALTWDEVEQREFEVGVDHGVLYPYNTTTKLYDTAAAWNGLTEVTDSPSGAEEQAFYADNIKYASLRSAENYGGTINAYTYPDEFAALNGSPEVVVGSGVRIAQQARGMFGFSYRSNIGDASNSDKGYKLHLIWGATVSPSEQTHETTNESPELSAMSWEYTTTPETITAINPATGKQFKPSANMVIDSTKVSAEALAKIEAALYGTAEAEAYLPKPDVIIGWLSENP